MQNQSEVYNCLWCLKAPEVKRWEPFCSEKCAKADARDREETERDKYEMRY
jgi:endogenous inhibitor of DNA gyrase (YacG/DUF329 family)